MEKWENKYRAKLENDRNGSISRRILDAVTSALKKYNNKRFEKRKKGKRNRPRVRFLLGWKEELPFFLPFLFFLPTRIDGTRERGKERIDLRGG